MTANDEAILADLLLRWEELRSGQHPPTVDELCREHPHLTRELAHRIDVLTTMGWLDEPIGSGCAGNEPPPTELAPCPLAGRYRLDTIVAEGGFARVWRGWDMELERDVAVKCPRRVRVDSAESFLIEARRVARLTHPGIVPVFDVGRDGDTCFIVSQFVAGGSLADLLEHGEVALPRIVRWTAEVADAVEFAHREGVIHRDIKPANILVDRHDRALLADFGIAVQADAPPTLARGTFRYMSPQQREGHASGPRDDVYSLGVVLEEALARRPAGSPDSRQGRGDDATLAAAMARVVRRATASDPAARHASAAELAADLRQSLPRRGSSWAIPAALAGVLLAAVAGLLLLPKGAPAPKEQTRAIVDRDWIERIAALPAEAQLTEVSAKLRALNEGFNGDLKPTIEDGVVVGIELLTDRVTDISPLMAFRRLRSLLCDGTFTSRSHGRLSDLSPLRGMALEKLELPYNEMLRDLSPLERMPLKHFHCGRTGISDLRPLTGMTLESFVCGASGVTDLGPLRGMPLATIYCNQTRVADLAPLAGMPLKRVFCQDTPVASVEPLRGAPLEVLECHRTDVADIEPLRGMGGLWALNVLSTKVTDFSPIDDLPGLKVLFCDFVEQRDARTLRQAKWLESINGNSVVDFWKLLDSRRTEDLPAKE